MFHIFPLVCFLIYGVRIGLWVYKASTEGPLEQMSEVMREL